MSRVGECPVGGGTPGITRSSTCQRVPLAVLTSEPATLRMVLQWLIAAIRAGWRDGARALDTAPLALPAQLLLTLCAPLALPHASASLVLAVLYALADQRPATATPLIHRLIHTRGPSGDLWAELLNLGPDTARDGPNTARNVPNTARGGPGAHNSPASRSSSAGSLPPVPPPMLPGAHLGAPRACDAISRV